MALSILRVIDLTSLNKSLKHLFISVKQWFCIKATGSVFINFQQAFLFSIVSIIMYTEKSYKLIIIFVEIML